MSNGVELLDLPFKNVTYDSLIRPPMLISSLLQEPIPFGKAISTEIKYDSYENVNSQYILGIFEDFKVFVKYFQAFSEISKTILRDL